MTEIAIKDLKDLCAKALRNAGLSKAHTEIIIDHYLENELSGKKSHGMVRVIQLIQAVKDIGLPKQTPKIIKDTGQIAVIDAHMNFGPVIGKMLVDESITRAKKHGLSFVGGNHYYGNTGSMAYYIRRLVDENLIALISCNSVSCVAAPSGKEKLLGTNPLGLGIPSADGKHFIADFATSAIAYGKVMVAMDKGEALPEGCIIDKDGLPSTRPEDAYPEGAILPLADYRGFALGLFIEMVSMMIGGTVLNDTLYGKDSFFIIAIDPQNMNPTYTQQVESIFEQIRSSAPAPGHNNVTIPGDRSSQELEKTLNHEYVDIVDKTLEKIRKLAP